MRIRLRLPLVSPQTLGMPIRQGLAVARLFKILQHVFEGNALLLVQEEADEPFAHALGQQRKFRFQAREAIAAADLRAPTGRVLAQPPRGKRFAPAVRTLVSGDVIDSIFHESLSDVRICVVAPAARCARAVAPASPSFLASAGIWAPLRGSRAPTGAGAERRTRGSSRDRADLRIAGDHRRDTPTGAPLGALLRRSHYGGGPRFPRRLSRRRQPAPGRRP